MTGCRRSNFTFIWSVRRPCRPCSSWRGGIRGAGAAGVPGSAAELAAFYEFRDFPHFSQVYGAVSSLVREPADVAALVLGAARDLAGQNVRYAELTVTPYTFTAAGMPVAELTEALDLAARSAAREHGITMAYIFDVAGEYGEPAGARDAGARAVLPARGAEGLRAGRDRAGPAPVRRRVPLGVRRGHRGRAAQRAARGRDVRSRHDLGGAGRAAGRADRALASAAWTTALVARLRESQVPLEVCPTSNVCTRQVPGLAAHPLPRMLAEGLFVTLNSDDPPMFGTTLTEEYRRAASVLGLGRAPAGRAGGQRGAGLVPGRGREAGAPGRDRRRGRPAGGGKRAETRAV